MDEIQAWFEQLLQLRYKHCFYPSDIWNMDETGFQIGVARAQKVLTQSYQSEPFVASSGSRETITVIKAISANGESTPPLIIVPGKTYQRTWSEELHGETVIAVTDSGYSNDFIALQWLEHFKRHSSQLRTGSHRLLILDSYNSYCTKDFIEYCDEKNIVLFALPPHTTHLLQPLDVGVFQPYKHWQMKALDEAIQNGYFYYRKDDFLASFESFRAKALLPSTITSAFAKTGIEPFDPEAILSKLCSQEARQSTPETPPQSEWTTPQLVRTITRFSAMVISQSMSDELRKQLTPLLKGAEIQAIAGAEAVDKLNYMTVNSQARKARQSRQRQGLQRGGLLSAAKARDKARLLDEEQKAKALRRQAREEAAQLKT